MTWQPIETAPMDGTPIRLRGRFSRAKDGPVVETEGRYDTGGFTEGWETLGGSWFAPSHWAPLPEPPSP